MIQALSELSITHFFDIFNFFLIQNEEMILLDHFPQIPLSPFNCFSPNMIWQQEHI